MNDNSNERGMVSTGPKRLWMPAVLLVLALIGLGWSLAQPELERNIRSWIFMSVVGLWMLLNFLWFVIFSGLRWKVRLAGVGIVLVTVGVVSQLVKVDGTADGTGRPNLVLKWKSSGRAQFKAAEATPSGVTNVLRALPPGAADVSQLFGSNRDGVVTNVGLARDWKANPPRELWRQAVGGGWSAFAVVGGVAYTQEQRGDGECVTCYELMTGRLVWAHTNQARFFQWQGGEGPRATPTVSKGKVYALGGTGILECLDAETGRPLWKRDVLAEHQLPNLIWGVSASPLIEGRLVVVTGGMTNGPTVLAYDRESGEQVWKSGKDKASYASPVATALAGKRVILSVNAASLTAHDPSDGGVLFDYAWPPENWPKASQPVILDGDRVFISAGYGVGCVMLQISSGGDGRLSVTELWKNKMMKTQFNSATHHRGALFGLDDGLLACVDAPSGRRLWKDGRYASGQTVMAGDLIVIQAESGFVALAEAALEGFKELGRIDALSSKTWNFPTLAGRYLLVRNDREAVCYELPVSAGIPPAGKM